MKKKYALGFFISLLTFWVGFGQIATQSFETTGDTWTPLTFSTPPCTNSGDRWNYSTTLGAFTPSDGNQFWGIQDLNGNCGGSGFETISLPNFNLSAYNSVELSFDYNVFEFDTSDDIKYELFFDNVSQGEVVVVDGFSNFSTPDWVTENVSIPDTVVNVSIIISVRQNGGGDYGGIDNIVLDGVSACTPPSNPTGSITSSNGTTTCTSTSLSYTNTPPANVIYYWQTISNGTSVASPTSANFTANTLGTNTYYVRAYDTVAMCWSTGNINIDITIDAAIPSISTQPVDQNIVLPGAASFNVAATSNSTETYQWQVNTGSGWNNVPGANANSYTIATTTAAMDGDQYRCIVTNTCGNTTSNFATLNLSNNAPNNVTGIFACFEDTSVDLSWNAPGSGATPDGYVVFILQGATDPAGITGDASAYNGFNTDYSLAPTASGILGRYVYKGNTTNTIITGLTEDDNYSITVYAYVGETLTGWSPGGTGGSTWTNGFAQGDIRNLASTPDNNQVTLNWNNPTPTSCWDQLIIVANEGAVVFTPTGDGSLYSGNDNDVYSSNNQLVYETTSNVTNKAIFGLTNGTQYCFTVFIRRGTTWSEGVEICETPEVTYCDSFGDDTDGFLTGIRRVQFNTIDNSTPIEDNDYSDFTNQSTDVFLGEGYDLTVNVNTDGPYDVFTRAWIDWNNDGDFNDSGEQYELGDAFDAPDVATTNSPLNIEVPVTAAVGTTRMRISAKYDAVSTSCETGFDGEVEDYTINVVQSSNAEINIKGNNITIANGFSAPYGLNNTLFAATNLSVTTAPKAFTIQNVGLANLSLTGSPIVEITGANAGDFAVSLQPTSTSLGSYAIENFEITFTPTVDGVRTAIVSIANTDSDENPYTFSIEGTGVCTTAVTSNLLPDQGPEGTEVTINSPGNNLTAATATLNGIPLTVLSSSNTELVVQLPVGSGVTSGNLVVTLTTGCSSTNVFTVLDTVINGCETGSSATTPSDLFISEVTDATSGSSTFVEIFNGTGAVVNLADYEVNIYNNGSSSASSSINLTGTLANNNVLVLDIGTTSCPLNNLSISVPPQYTFSGLGGINFDLNGADAIQIEKVSGGNLGVKDSFGVQGSNSWANSLSIGTDGANFRRKNNATPLPNGASFDIAQWDVIDWTNCADSDYVNIGLYDFSVGVPPTITTHPSATNTNCDTSVSLSVAANEGVSGGLELNYTWFYLVPGASSWVEITSNSGLYSGFDQSTLVVSFTDTVDVNGYQYYCQVREDSNTCYQASNAIKLEAQRALWNGTWSATPDINTIAIIAADYNTSIGGVENQISFEACNLVVDAAVELIIANSDYVRVANNVINDGTITVQTAGSLVQDGIDAAAGVFTNNGTARVIKQTSDFFDDGFNYHYTYWSSPVVNSDIVTVFPNPRGNRRYYFDSAQYIDTNGDDISDTANDWQVATGSMEVGRGYAVTATIPPGFPYNNTNTFVGDFNTGNVTKSIVLNGFNGDNDWNFIGNPYPSAIDFEELYNQNMSLIEGAAFLWSQAAPPDVVNPGNEVLNFNTSDYAIITANSGNTAGGAIGLPPTDFIPSGQGFFVRGILGGTLTFKNDMRSTGNNTIFYSADDAALTNRNSDESANRLWLDLTSDNGIFSQILVAYVTGGTDDFDDWSYDAPRNLSTGTYASFYSIIENDDREFAIQGKNPESLVLEEVIKLGFINSINEPTLYKISIPVLEGEFMEGNTIYLKDNLLNTIHDLKESDYNFTSEVGEFNDRFEIVFTLDPLSVDEFAITASDLIIIDINESDVKFKINGSHSLETIKIIDLLGRTLYYFDDINASERIFNLSNLSQATYIAEVTLSNGQVITKKAVKRK